VVLSRAMDVERSRGSERDICIEEMRQHYAPAVALAMSFAIASLLCMGLLERLPGMSSLGLWKEAIGMAVLAAISVWLLFRYMLPVLYLRSEQWLDHLAYWLIRKPLMRKLMRQLLR